MSADRRTLLLAIVGPTGIGKTALAVALARELPIEAISVDSRQVYRRLDIGTGKPTAAERRELPHHLIDVVEPDEVYDAARFAREARVAITAIRARERYPVLVGGTGLYYRALVYGLAARPPADPRLRHELRAEAVVSGAVALHRRLATLDPATAARLHPRDLVRVTRALEVVLLTGAPVEPDAPDGAWKRGARSERVLTIVLTMDRGALNAALDARADRMIAAGLLEEVEALVGSGVPVDAPAMQGIGYRHLVPVVTRGQPVDRAVAIMKRDTRRYAKRQETWFAREEGVHRVTIRPGGLGAALDEIKKLIDRTRIFEYADSACHA